MSDDELMARLNAIESDIGTPGFWERAHDAIDAVIKDHAAALNEAVNRGLTTFSTWPR
jgi:hypothetical protein